MSIKALNRGALSHFTQGEIIRPALLPLAEKNVITLDIPIQLVNRNIYLYLEAKFTTASYYIVACEVEALLYGTPRGRFPCVIADVSTGAPTLNRSLPSVLNGGGSAVGNSLALKIVQPFTVNTEEAVLQPFQITAEIDQLRLHCDGSSA